MDKIMVAGLYPIRILVSKPKKEVRLGRGHMSGEEILETIRRINPETVIPVHTPLIPYLD